MSTWLFDLGNSRLKCAALNADGSVGDVHALGHDESRFADALAAVLPQQAVSACLASVASPELTLAVMRVLAARFRRVSIARSSARLAGVQLAYPQPSRLGVDRFLALLAARARGPQPWLVASVGTALTIDLLDGQGLHRGGRIAPSPRLMREALHRAAAHLPAGGGDFQEFATTTENALVSGCEGAALGLIERSLQHAELLLGQAPTLLLHGGGADGLASLLPQAQHSASLVLDGLALWSRVGAVNA